MGKNGFTIIEILLATAIFLTISGAAIISLLSGQSLNQTSAEQTIATQYATEGLEAVHSIKNQAYSNLINSTGTGVGLSGGLYTFSGTNNTFDKYTRVITVSDTQRDGSGNIVSSGGTVDGNTKKITSTVTWNVAGARTNSVILTNYLTNFRQAINTSSSLVVYGDGTTTPKYRTYDRGPNSFSSGLSTIPGSSAVNIKLAISPTKTEAIVGYVTSAGTLQIICYNGASWSNDWSTTVGGTGTTTRFDLAYETSTGDVLVLYSTNTGTTNELALRTKPGGAGCGSGNWSSVTNFDPLRTSGIVQWVSLVTDRRASSNLIAAAWADSNSDLSAAIWSGTAIGNEPAAVTETNLERIAASQDINSFDLEYESSSGDLMLAWGTQTTSNNANGVRYRTCTGGTATCTWNAVTTPPTFNDDATTLDLSANPNTDELVFASIGNQQSDLQVGYWSGSAWTNNANTDNNTQTPVAGSQLVSTGWLVSGSTTRSVVVYNDNAATNIGWYIGNGSTFSVQTDFSPTPAFNASQGWYDIQTDPTNKNQLMFTITSSPGSLFAKRLEMTSTPAFTWTNSDGGAALTTTLPQIINSPAAFAYFFF